MAQPAHRPRLPARAGLLLAGVALIFVAQSLVGITWGLPSKRIDKYLFSGETPWPGEKIARLAGAADRFSPNTGADVDVDPIERAADQPVLLNGSDEQIAEIYLRYRLYTHQPDEMITMMALSGMRPSELRFDPRLYQYGGLFIYPVGALIKLAGFGGLIDVRSDLVFYLDNPDEFGKFYVVARAYSAAWGLIGVFLVFGIARRLSDWRGGVLAALLYSVMPVVVCMSHEGKPHLPGATLMLAAVWFAMRYLEVRGSCVSTGAPPLSAAEGWGTEDTRGPGKNRSLTVAALTGGRWDWWMMCACCGAAVGMVLSSAPIFVLIPLTAWIAHRRRSAPPVGREDAAALTQESRFVRDLAIGASIAPAVYLVTNPYILINAFVNRDVLGSNFGNSLAMYEIARIGEGFVRVIELSVEGATLPVVLFGAVGLIVAMFRRRAEIIPLAVVGIVLFVQFVLIGAGKPAEYGRFGVFTNTTLAIGTALCTRRFVRFERRGIQWVAIPVLILWAMFGGWAYLANFSADAGDADNRSRTSESIQFDLRRARPDRDRPLEVAVIAEPAPYGCPPLDFRQLSVVLHRSWDAARDGSPDPNSNRVAVRPVDAPGKPRILVPTSPISWANKPFEVEPMWQDHR